MGDVFEIRWPRIVSTATRKYLDAVARDIFGPIMDLEVPSRTGWRVIGWDAEHGVSLTLAHGDRVLLIEVEARDDSRDCYHRTARFNLYVRPLFRAGQSLTLDERRVVDQVARIVGGREQRLPLVPRPAPSRGSDVREVHVDRVLVCEGHGHYYINPYTGCTIGCDFCYVSHRSDFSRQLEGLPSLPWGRYVDVKVNAAEVLRQEVVKHPPGIVRLSPIVTDPYQPLEGRYRITRQCLEVLLEAGFTPFILTRSARVVDDLELLSRFRRAAVGLSIPTDDDRVRRVFERRADPIERRLEALARCQAAGLTTFGVIQPMLPMDVARLVDAMAPVVNAVRIDRMYELPRSRALYESIGRLDAMEEAFFDRTASGLRQAFVAAGVAIDDLDDLGAAIGLA